MEIRDTRPLTNGERAAAYRLIAESLLYPEDRNRRGIEAWRRALEEAADAVTTSIDRFYESDRSDDADEYLSVLELAPPCPLYLGAYLFDEPSTCRGAGLSPRNAYMVELGAVYRHFGFELGGGELADFLPAMLEFLALTLEHRQEDDIGLRRRFLEHYLAPALSPMKDALDQHESPYRHLIEALEALLEGELAVHADVPAWTPERLGQTNREARVTS